VASSRNSWALLSLLGASLAAGAAFSACSPENEGDNTGGSDTTGNPGPGAGAAGSGGGPAGPGVGGAGGFNPVGVGGSTCMGGDDQDGDGFTIDENDCNDCDPFVNPNAVEVIAEPDEDGGVPEAADEDCDGEKDNVPPPCDQGIPVDEADPLVAAQAIGMCAYVKKATWVVADGSPPPVDATQLANFHLGHGVLEDLGVNNVPQEGERMLMLSSGTARRDDHAEFVHRNFIKGYTSNSPFGFPKESPTCPGVTTQTPNDAAGLEVELVAPANAQGIKFDFNFFTYEWPQFICTTYNDFFVAIMDPFPPMQLDGNISFDGQGNPISVNNAFLDVCGCPSGPPCGAPPSQVKKQFDCAFGQTGVVGTDFDDDDGTVAGWTNGSTGWLRTSAPVEPGKPFKIRFVTYDSSDGKVDSSTLIDNWQWSAKPGSVETIVPD
jgi:hypothetical protein